MPRSREMIDRAQIREVLALTVPVLSPTEVVTQKLRALHEHHCDFSRLLPSVRAVREQLDWPQLRAGTSDNPFAVAFLSLCDALGIAVD